MSDVISNSKNLLFVEQGLVEALIEEARKSSRKMARLLMHLSHQDPVQEMLIVMHAGCAVTPNRAEGRSESLLVVEGEMLLIVFDEDGKVVQEVEMGPPRGGKTFLYRLNSTPWHTMVPRSEIVVVHETLQGPFAPSSETQPEWIPKDTEELRSFLAQVSGK